MYLTDNFIKSYETKEIPFGGTGLGHFIYLRTYARWDEENQRREYWHETIRRVVEYSMSLYQGPATVEELTQEAEELFDAIFNMQLFSSGRTLWIGGTPISYKYGESNFNCAFISVDSFDAVVEAMHMLMHGVGVGFRVLPIDINKLPMINPSIVLANKPYHPKMSNERIEETLKYEGDGTYYIVVGDSKQGWINAIWHYLTAIQRNDIESIIVNYDSIRAKGELLKTFGGTAGGHEALRDMLRGIHKIIRKATRQLKPIDLLDIMNTVGEGIVVGGVRRTAEIALFELNDTDILNAKIGIEDATHNNYSQRQRYMSNNSVLFTERPTKIQLHDIFNRIKETAEPGFINHAAMRKRRPNAEGTNPCGEILLDTRGLCNLVEINLVAHVKNGQLDLDLLKHSLYLVTRANLRQTNVKISLPEWNKIQERDRLLGVSLDGVIDAEELLNWQTVAEYGTSQELYDLLPNLRIIVHDIARYYAKEMRIPEPLLVTTIKPSGTLSKLPVISSGIHRDYSEYYIRRIRITAADALAKTMLELDYPIYPETGQGPNAEQFDRLSEYEKIKALEKASTWVVEFPVKSPAKTKAWEESAIQQFRRYLTFQRQWTDHNTSITIYFDDNEINDLIDVLYDNWDDYVGVSFLPKRNNVYPLMPIEIIDEVEYNTRVSKLAGISTIRNVLTDIEFNKMMSELIGSDCDGGSCPIR